MRDPFVMCMHQGAGNLLGVSENLIKGEGIAHGLHRSDMFSERAAGQIFDYGEGLRIGLADIENRSDVRMFQEKKLAGILDLTGMK